jgi:hypothetical protein
MTEHAFKIGDEVRLVGRIAASPAEAFLHLVTLSERNGAAKPWQIVRLLPPDGVGFQYHVRCPIDGSERIAHESELARDGR